MLVLTPALARPTPPLDSPATVFTAKPRPIVSAARQRYSSTTRQTPEHGVEPSDPQLIQRCLQGDQDAYAALLERYRDRCFWTALKFVRNPEDAADVVQEAFIKAFHMLARFDLSRAFFTWLYRIVANVAIDHIRRRESRPAVALEEVSERLPSANTQNPLDEASRSESQAAVHAALDLLPETYRTVLILNEIEGRTCKEIGELLDVPHATARWRLHHARKLFKDVWERRILKLKPEDGAAEMEFGGESTMGDDEP